LGIVDSQDLMRLVLEQGAAEQDAAHEARQDKARQTYASQ
jgi:hypothetical protein